MKTQECMYRDTTNVEPEMYDYANNNGSHWNSNEKLKRMEAVQENIRYIIIIIIIIISSCASG